MEPTPNEVDLSRIDNLLRQAIEDCVTPGACYAVGTASTVSYGCVGRLTYSAESPPTALETIWDLASLTKVVGTTTAAMLLVDRSLLNLDCRVADVIPAFGRKDKDTITIRNLLLHDSGLPASLTNSVDLTLPSEVINAVWDQELQYETGTQTTYSDVGFIALGATIEALAGKRLGGFLRDELFHPLAMDGTSFSPQRTSCAPTEPVEPWRQRLRQRRGLDGPEVHEVERGPDGTQWITGEVHDPTAMVMGGEAGHAGLFSTVGDVAKFMQFMLRGGAGLVRPEVVELFTRRNRPESSRSLGWDTPSEGSSAGNRFGPRSFGHTGFTGTSAWADHDLGIFAVLLTNRVHPTAANMKIKELRVAFHDLIAE
jgi:CubicO group peptidase (beta-lactamase class C family)